MPQLNDTEQDILKIIQECNARIKPSKNEEPNEDCESPSLPKKKSNLKKDDKFNEFYQRHSLHNAVLDSRYLNKESQKRKSKDHVRLNIRLAGKIPQISEVTSLYQGILKDAAIESAREYRNIQAEINH